MPVFVSLGRYSESAIKGLLAKPEDRTAAVKKLIEQAGGKQLAWYMLFGEFDFISIADAERQGGRGRRAGCGRRRCCD
jgi:uncharacterized protein with GYD domain